MSFDYLKYSKQHPEFAASTRRRSPAEGQEIEIECDNCTGSGFFGLSVCIVCGGKKKVPVAIPDTPAQGKGVMPSVCHSDGPIMPILQKGVLADRADTPAPTAQEYAGWSENLLVQSKDVEPGSSLKSKGPAPVEAPAQAETLADDAERISVKRQFFNKICDAAYNNLVRAERAEAALRQQPVPRDEIIDIQRRCRVTAEEFEALAKPARVDVVVSADLLLEASSLLRGYHQSLLVRDFLHSAAGKETPSD